MPTAEIEAWEIATTEATGSDGAVDEDRRFAVYKAEYERRIAERRESLTRDTRAVFRAMDGWARVESEEEWHATVERAATDLETGGFFIDRLGAERYLDPELMAALLVLRRKLIDEYGADGAADLMLIDAAVLAYHHTLRINGWIGNLQGEIESEVFGTEGMRVVVDGKRRSTWDVKVKGLRVVELLDRLGEQILPLLDRSNRMMLRNLRASSARRQAPTPSISIGRAGQVNVAAVQTNEAGRGTRRAPRKADDA
jgi:hypothetical protein